MEWRELPGTDGATFPFWSPDSRHVGFFADRRLMRIDVANELTQTLCDVRSGQGGTWGTQDVIVFADATGLSRVPASGGAPVPVTKVDSSDGQRDAHLWPHFLPDGHRFVFLVQKAHNDEAATHVGQVDAGGSVAIADGRGPAAFVADVLLFSRDATLATQQFDQSDWRDRRGGDSRRRRRDRGQHDRRIRVLGVEHGPRLQAWRGAETATHMVRPCKASHFGVVGQPAEYTGFALSPDGRRVAVARRGDDEGIERLADGCHLRSPLSTHRRSGTRRVSAVVA